MLAISDDRRLVMGVGDCEGVVGCCCCAALLVMVTALEDRGDPTLASVLDVDDAALEPVL